MSKEFHESITAGIDHIGAANAALQHAAALCEEALTIFAAATQGSAQPEVNAARHGFVTAAAGMLQTGGVIAHVATTFTSYAASLYPEADPVPLAPATQAQVTQEDDFLHPGPLLSDKNYQQFPTTLQMSGENDSIRIEVPGGFAGLSVYRHTPHGSEANIDYMGVEEGQQQGKGTYLIATAAREASLRGIENFSGYYISPYALRALAKVVGQENIIIKSPASPKTYLQSKDYATAIDDLDRQQADPEADTKGVKARVDLRKSAVQSRLFGR